MQESEEKAAEAASERKSSTTSFHLAQVREQFQNLEETFASVLPKVDRALLIDFLNREKVAKDEDSLSYTLEVFTKEGVDTERAREYIYEKTGMMPAIYDKGTHYVTNQILTLQMLKEINDSDDVVEIRGSNYDESGMSASNYERARQ